MATAVAAEQLNELGEFAGEGRVGAWLNPNGVCYFRVWAPDRDSLSVCIEDEGGMRLVELESDGGGYWSVESKAAHGSRYFFVLDGDLERPDPASQWQPSGVFGRSAVVDHGRFSWSDEKWKGLAREDYVIYELHVGVFSDEGSFAGVEARLDHLVELGVTAVELMPVAQFSGERNWGYDGAYPFAVQESYGGPEGLKRLVNACHTRGLAVVLDVVYNHFGPEGAFVADFGPYFTNDHRTPWGDAVNLAGEGMEGVREFFVQNAVMWLREYHVDGLRLDGIHTYFDGAAEKSFLCEMQDRIEREFSDGVPRVLFAERESLSGQERRSLREAAKCVDAQWSYEVFHCLVGAIGAESCRCDQEIGQMTALANAIRTGEVFPSEARAKAAAQGELARLVTYLHSHDQVGNRSDGLRLWGRDVSMDRVKTALGVAMLTPHTPLLFMGEEYGEDRPFWYFVDPKNPELVSAAQITRNNEFGRGPGQPMVGSVDARDDSVLDIDVVDRDEQARQVFDWYRAVLSVRRELLVVRDPEKWNVGGDDSAGLLRVAMTRGSQVAMLVANFGDDAVDVGVGAAAWKLRWSSRDGASDDLPPFTCALYVRD